METSPLRVFLVHSSCKTLNSRRHEMETRERRVSTYNIVHLVGFGIHDKCDNEPIKT